MIGGALRIDWPPPMKAMNGEIRLNVHSRFSAGKATICVAVPVVHAGAEHRQRGLALDQGREGQRSVVVLLYTLLQRVEVVVLVGQGMCQLVRDHRLVLVLVEVALLAEEPLEEARLLLGRLLRFFDQVHRLGLGIVERGDFLRVDLGQRFAQVVVSRQQPEGLQGQLIGTELLRRHVLIDFLENQFLHVFALGDVALHLVLERDLPELRQQLLHPALVPDHGLGELPVVGELVSFLEELGTVRERRRHQQAPRPGASRTEERKRSSRP